MNAIAISKERSGRTVLIAAATIGLLVGFLLGLVMGELTGLMLVMLRAG